MSVCATCLQPGLPVDGKHDCPGLGDIQLTRQLGHGLRVDTAPARARMALNVLADHGYGLRLTGDDHIDIAEQVRYRVVGYDAESAALVLELVEDWRPVRAPDEEDEEPTGPAKPGIPRCTATWETEYQGTVRCWRAATHNQREGYEAHMGEVERGYRFQWIGTEPGAIPHQPEPDATVCTPIPAETLMQMSEVPAGLLSEGQRAANAEARLRLAREALIRDGYFTADEVDDEIAPRIVEWLSHHRQELEQARADARTLGASVQEWHDTAVRHQRWGRRRWNAWKSARARAQRVKAELDRLTAGEEPGWDPLVVPTPGQWIARWNSLRPTERLALAQAVIEAAETTNRCHFEAHRQRLEEDQQAWATVARVRDLRDSWLLMTLEPGQVRRLLDGITRALDGSEGPGAAEPPPGFVPVRSVARSWGEPSDGDPLAVEPYRNDRNQDRWAFRCWGTATCDGWLSLDHYSQESAERARDRHVPEEHGASAPAATESGTCTASLTDSVLTNGDTLRCIASAGHYDETRRPEHSKGGAADPRGWHHTEPDGHGGRTVWADWADGATPHRPDPIEEQPMTTCTATIDGPHVLGGGPVHCTREAGHPENHVGPKRGADGKVLWTDHNAGATPHGASASEEG